MASDFAQFVRACLERQARRHPDRPAVVDVAAGTVLDCRTLYVRVCELAKTLRRPDASPPALYLLPSSNGVEKLVLWLGAWVAGAAVLNVDTEFLPAERVRSLIAAARPTGVLSLSSQGPACRPLHADHGGRPMPARTVLVNCTSGTTGLPKLVYHSSAALVHNGRVSARLMALEEGEPCLEVRSMNWFSAQILSLMPFLLVGTRLHVAPAFSASRLHGWLAGHRIRFMPMVPTMVRIMLGVSPALPATLTRFSCSSSELAAAVWQRAEDAWGIPLVNLYGSSELGWICGSDAAARRIGRVGFPVEGVQVEVRREAGARAAEPGRILVSSPYAALATRTVHDGALHAFAIPADTQDLGCLDASCRLALTGRADDMILRGGVNIHPGEVEKHVESVPGVREAVVFAVDDAMYGAVVGCAFTGVPGLQADDIAIQLATRLPAAWQPVYWWKLDSIPLGANGKISRRQLRQRLTESLPPPLAPRSARRNEAIPPARPCGRSGASQGAVDRAD